MKLHFIGVYAGYPQKNHTTTGFCLELDNGALYLFDCPENTQSILGQLSLPLERIHAIFISHMHMDHVAGLIPLLQTTFVKDKSSVMKLFGPTSIQNYVNFNFQLTYGSDIPSTFQIFEVEDGFKAQLSHFSLQTKKITHVVPSFGYLLEFPGSESINYARLREAGFPFGLEIKKIRAKQNVEADGKIFNYQDYYDVIQPIRLAFCLDCSFDDYFTDLDYLVTELTFLDQDDMAEKTGHTCLAMLKNGLAKIKVQKLILSHFSQRWAHFDNQEVSHCQFAKTHKFQGYDFEFEIETAMAVPKCHCILK